jgi:hypothetical protein
MKKKKGPSCNGCVHYYITWDIDYPYGCHAMGFKSRRSPGLEVRQTMQGQACLMFTPKPEEKKRKTRPPKSPHLRKITS